MRKDRLYCETHGGVYETFVCEHLVKAKPGVQWYSEKPTKDFPYPDAWCGRCNKIFEKAGGWNEESESKIKVTLLCHECYEGTRKRSEVHYV